MNEDRDNFIEIAIVFMINPRAHNPFHHRIYGFKMRGVWTEGKNAFVAIAAFKLGCIPQVIFYIAKHRFIFKLFIQKFIENIMI